MFLLSFNGKVLKETGGLEDKLKREKEKELLSNDQAKAAIRTAQLTRLNILIGWLLGMATLLVVVSNLYITLRKDKREREQLKAKSAEQATTQQNIERLNNELHQISLSLKDTSTVKAKIVK